MPASPVQRFQAGCTQLCAESEAATYASSGGNRTGSAGRPEDLSGHTLLPGRREPSLQRLRAAFGIGPRLLLVPAHCAPAGQAWSVGDGAEGMDGNWTGRAPRKAGEGRRDNVQLPQRDPDLLLYPGRGAVPDHDSRGEWPQVLTLRIEERSRTRGEIVCRPHREPRVLREELREVSIYPLRDRGDAPAVRRSVGSLFVRYVREWDDSGRDCS